MYAFIHYSMNTYTDQEWGFGNENPKLFNPSNLDCRQWARVCKQAGMRGIIFTAKHHCGFCMWPSAYTEYSVKNSPWKNGKGDVVRELAEACREEGLAFAVYLSPWDRNHPEYGRKAYVTYFRNQLRELLTNYGDIFEVWFDGANGGDGWYGGANEVRKIDRTTYYEWPETYKMIRTLQPKCLIWNDGSDRGDLRWVGTEAGNVGETNWSLLNHDGEVTWSMLHYGLEDGDSWVPGETNTSIRPGWFYHETENEHVKSLSKLMDTYYKSVGRNSTLLLNFPIAPNGRIHPNDSLRGIAFKKMIDEVFKTDLAKNAKVTTEGTETIIDFRKPTAFNRFVAEEDIRYGQRVRKFYLEAEVNGLWVPLKDELVEGHDGLTTIGHRRIICFPTITATRLRFNILDTKCNPVIKRTSVYLAPELTSDIPNSGEKLSSNLHYFFSNPKQLMIDWDSEQTITSFRYLPPQKPMVSTNRPSEGIITHYTLWASSDWSKWTKVASGEFSNIVNNPIWQTIKFAPIKAKILKLDADRLAEGDRMAFDDIEIVREKSCDRKGVSAQNQSLFDSGWQFTRNGKTISVDLPHDWDIYEAPDPATGTTKEGGGWYPGGKGEYRKTFKTPDADIVKLHFEGVYQKAEVFVNGQKAGQHAYGYTPFTIDVTPYLYKDKRDNVVLVKVDNSQQPNCRWYSGSGIYRHVWLQTKRKRYIDEWSVNVKTPDIHTVNIKAEVVMEDGSRKPIEKTLHVEQPHLWSPDDPYLYTTTIEAEGDVLPVTYGIRTIEYSAEKGFILNGKPILINGACVHHDDGVLGAMAFDAAEIRKVRLMKDAGFNLIRTSHNPTTRAFLDACDSIGMLVIDEAFDGWRTQKNPYDYSTLIDSCYREDIHAMVLRDRNHPSVICWSIGNEVIERKDIRVITTARKLKQAILETDDTRPVTEALCAWDSDWEIYDPHFDVLDIGGYNYMIHKHDTDHQRAPKRVMWQTESFPRDAFKNWALVREYPYVIGDIVWTGLDYLGESGIGRTYYEGERAGEHWIEGGIPEWHGAYCGDVDITGWRKPISHYREMLWKDSKDLYMAVREPDGYRGKIHETSWSVWPTWQSWTWPGWEGKPIDVEVYTKAPEVRLYLNNHFVGTKAVGKDTEYKAVFKLPYKPGTLRAVAGSRTASISTAGKPAHLRLTPDRRVITADGQDLAYITIEVVDSKGRICPDAAIPCEAIVKGEGSLLSFASADLRDREPYTSPRVTTWKGRAILVVRSTEEKGSIQVGIKSSLPAATIAIQSQTKQN